MNDCPNAAVRDLLPDLVHGPLRGDARLMVEAHLPSCADCQAELGLLRDLRGALRRTPAVDVAAIVAAVPAYAGPARRSWVGWRTAAAITVLVAGGASVALLERPVGSGQGTNAVPTSTVAALEPAQVSGAAALAGGAPVTGTSQPISRVAGPLGRESGVAAHPAAEVAGAAPSPDVGGRELAMAAGSLNDLSDRELTSLLRDIESLDAVPSLDVDNTPSAPIAPEGRRRASGAP